MEGNGRKQEKTHDVPWQLVNLKCHIKQQVNGELILPSQIHKRYTGAWIHPPVRLLLTSKNEHTTHALNIMRDSTGRNILHARLVTEGPPGVCAWVEPFSGNLEHYLRQTKLGISGHRKTNSQTKYVLPNPILRSAVRQLVDGMEQIIESGHYHGNFSLANTYYYISAGEDPTTLVVKLCNFKEKKGKYKKKLAQDWTAVLGALNWIRETANTLKQAYPGLDLCQLDGLINFMRNLTPSNAEVAFEGIRRQPFFWGRVERRTFYIGAIPVALTKSQFTSGVKKARFIGLSWNKNELPAVLIVMNRYRENKGKKPYDINCRVAFVKFVSALYAHEAELKLWKKVDDIIQEHCPDLCYKLFVLLPRART